MFSATYLLLVKLMSFFPRMGVIMRLDDDVQLMKRAYDMCRAGGGDRIGSHIVIELDLRPPETRTRIRRKFLLDESCRIKFIIY